MWEKSTTRDSPSVGNQAVRTYSTPKLGTRSAPEVSCAELQFLLDMQERMLQRQNCCPPPPGARGKAWITPHDSTSTECSFQLLLLREELSNSLEKCGSLHCCDVRQISIDVHRQLGPASPNPAVARAQPRPKDSMSGLCGHGTG